MAFGRDTVVERGGSGDKLAKVVMIQEKCITLLCCATGGGLCVCVCASVEKKAGVGRLYLSPLWLASPSVVCCSFPYPHDGVFCLPLPGFPFESRVGIKSFTASEFIPEAVEISSAQSLRCKCRSSQSQTDMLETDSKEPDGLQDLEHDGAKRETNKCI